VIWENEFVELNKTLHGRESFDCGKEELNSFLKTKAAKHAEVGVSRTFILPSKDISSDGKTFICSFYTIAGATIKKSTLPKSLAKKLPHYPVPVLLIGQLAVHISCAGQGLGKITLIEALKRLSQINEHMPAYAVIVDCLDEEAEGFYQKYGFLELCRDDGRARMFLPMRTVLELFQDN
jgi:predicted GNAT family N-acyltransferase